MKVRQMQKRLSDVKERLRAVLIVTNSLYEEIIELEVKMDQECEIACEAVHKSNKRKEYRK